MNEIQTQQTGSTSMIDPKVMAQRINKMHELMDSVMRPDVHYGVIPGCKKPTLYLPGAQVIKVAFKIASKYTVEDLSVPGEKTYRVTAEVYDQQTGSILGYGVGECSSNEEKYAWRKAVCDEEFDSVLEERKRVKYGKSSNGGHYTEKQIKTNPSDIANTILKMATKRADIHGTINATAASEVFTQDIEDMPEGMEMGDSSPRQSSKPSVNPNDVKVAPGKNQSPAAQANGNVGTVEAVTTKSGTGGKGPWTKYGVKINGKMYGTFDKTAGEFALKMKGKKVVFTSKQDGEYENLLTISAFQEPVQNTALEVMDSEDFEKLATSLSIQAGLSTEDLNSSLFAEFSCKDLKSVRVEDQSQVIDWLSGRVEQAGS